MVAAGRVTILIQYGYAPTGHRFSIDLSMYLSIRLPPTGVVPPLPLCVPCWAERYGEVCTAAWLIWVRVEVRARVRVRVRVNRSQQ